MKKNFKRKILCTALFLFFFSGFVGFAQQSTVTGTVLDEQNNPMPYASVEVQKTTIGATADINGKFAVTGVPVGKQTIVISFLGYQTKLLPVTVETGKTIDLKVKMDPVAIQGKEVVITAQARGQAQAINQQLNANGIVNVVSADKIKELPDANAADAAGRLPGIMVQRNNGEGDMLIIRGLDPKYSSVALNGVVTPPSSATDRSTSMNLISPDIISGIEVSKANTADQDADGMGGTVNVLVKEADAKRRLDVSAQGGYSGQIDQYSNYKATLFYSDRYFDKKLGLMLAGNIESYDRSADKLDVSYDCPGYFQLPQINIEKLTATSDRRNRYNGSAIFDFRFNSKNSVKMVNMFSQTNDDIFQRQKSYYMVSGNSNQLRFQGILSNSASYMVSNAFDGKHILGNTELDWAVARSQTNSRKPNENTLQFRDPSPFPDVTTAASLNPLTAIASATQEDIRQFYLYQGIFMSYHNNETEWSGKLDYKIPFSFLNKQISGNIKLGGKMRIKDRVSVSDRWSASVYANTGANSVLNVVDRFLYEPNASGLLGIMSFLDPNFSAPRFLNGMSPSVNVNYALDRKKVAQFFNNNNPYPLFVPTQNITTGNLYQYMPNQKVQNDYTGHEDLYAAYLMGEINIGKMITFIPGVRLDYQYVRYTAYKGMNISDNNLDAPMDLGTIQKTLDSNTQINILPDFHLKIKPVSWFNIHLAFTETLARPDYTYLAPRTQIDPTSQMITFSSTKLRSTKSDNFDIICSFYTNKYGLFTIGAFRKNITDFIYKRTAYIVQGTPTDPSVFGLTNDYLGYQVNYPLNNTGKSYIQGLEIDAQTNFRWLPGEVRILRGIVFSGNATFMESQSHYQMTTFKSLPTGMVNADSIFTDRLVKQPNLLLNASLGYDYKGFSGRISYSYQDNVMITPSQRIDGYDRQTTLAFQRWDLQLKQKINKKLSVYFNMTNIFNAPDRGVQDCTGFYTSVGYYGMGMNLGIKYDL